MSVYHIAAIITVSVHASTALFQVLLLFLLVCCFVMRSLSLSLSVSLPLSLFSYHQTGCFYPLSVVNVSAS